MRVRGVCGLQQPQWRTFVRERSPATTPCYVPRVSKDIEAVVFAVDWPSAGSEAWQDENIEATQQARVREQSEDAVQDTHVGAISSDNRTTQSEAVRVVREVQAAAIPVAVLLLTGTGSDATTQHTESYSRILSGQQQLEQVGLTAQDFTAVSSVSYSGALLHVLESTLLAMGDDITPRKTLVVSCTPVDVEAFQQAGFRVAQLQSHCRHERSQSAQPDVVFTSWDQLQTSSLLQHHATPTSSSSSSTDSSTDRATSNEDLESHLQEPYPSHHARRPRPPFSQGVSLSLLELHSSSADSAPPEVPVRKPAFAASSMRGESTKAYHKQVSAAMVQNTAAAAFLSVDEELEDAVASSEGFGVHAVRGAAAHSAAVHVGSSSTTTASSAFTHTTASPAKDELEDVVEQEGRMSGEELQAMAHAMAERVTSSVTSSVVDWEVDHEPATEAHSKEHSHAHAHTQSSSVLNWDSDSEEDEGATKVLQGSVTVCTRSSVMQVVPGATKMEVIKRQAQALEDALAVEITVENDDTLLATTAHACMHASASSSEQKNTKRTPLLNTDANKNSTPESIESSEKEQPASRQLPAVAKQSSNGNSSVYVNGPIQEKRNENGGSDEGAKAELVDTTQRSTSGPPGGNAGSGGGDGGDASQRGWLEEYVPLPGGYKTTRRDVLKLIPLSGALVSFGALLSLAKGKVELWQWIRGASYVVQVGIFVYVYTSFSFLSKSFEYASPKAILSALMPRAQPTPVATDEAEVRHAAFKRFIASLERRGSSEKVPEFPSGAQWYNTGGPLKLQKELSGRVLVLDFWTFCCVNCMHVLPELAALQRKFAGQPVTVVGVHSAKFDNEKDARAVRSAVLRYEVEHPVVNDTQRALWGALGVSSWPTQVVVSPSGKVLFSVAGECHAQDIEDCVSAALEYYGEAGALTTEPLPLVLEKDKPQAAGSTALRYPGKITVHEAGDRLFIADSSNHRVVVTTLTGQHVCSVGGIGAGLRDGSFETAAFHNPQGLCYNAAADCVYVADTDSHTIRCIDIKARTVTTLAGNGTQGRDYRGGGYGCAQALSSPWDIALAPDNRSLLIAMAGIHQIWQLDLESGICKSVSGTGAEQNLNGDSSASTAWAQPSGLALSADGATAYIADAESSSIRAMNVATGGSTLLAGGDAFFAENLFQFGDKDASGSAARLQHPLATVCAPRSTVRRGPVVYFSDSYNHKIKSLDPETRAVKTIAGSGSVGFSDGFGEVAEFSEPGGLVVLSDGSILVTDTNNSVIRKLSVGDTANAWEVATVQLSDVPEVSTRELLDKGSSADTGRVPKGAALVMIGGKGAVGLTGEVGVKLNLPEGYHLTEGAGSGWETSVKMRSYSSSDSGPIEVSANKGIFNSKDSEPSLKITYSGSEGQEALLSVLLSIYFCQDGDVCLLDTAVVQVPIKCTELLGDNSGSSRDAEVVYNVRRQSSTAPKFAIQVD